jgi:hypothetical protein
MGGPAEEAVNARQKRCQPMSSAEGAPTGAVNRTPEAGRSGGQDLEPCTYAANSPDEVAVQLEPAAALEDEVQHDSAGGHREERERVTQSPADLWHVLEVHAVDGPHQRRREEDSGPGGDAFDLLVLVEAGLGQPFDLLVWR